MSNVSHSLYDELYKKQKIFKKYKLPKSPKQLGEGSYGIAYDIGSGKVMKITGDETETEAKASSLLVGKKPKYINEIYGVYYFKSKNVYIIFQKKLSSLSNKDIIWNILRNIDNVSKEWLGGYSSWEKLIKTKKDVDKFLGHMRDDSEERWKKYESWYTFFVFATQELNKYNILFNDYHPGNIMMDGNQIKVIDLGVSMSGRGKIDVIEQLQIYIRKIIKEIL